MLYFLVNFPLNELQFRFEPMKLDNIFPETILDIDIVKYFCLIILTVATSLSLRRSFNFWGTIGAFTNFAAILYFCSIKYILIFYLYVTFAKRRILRVSVFL